MDNLVFLLTEICPMLCYYNIVKLECTRDYNLVLKIRDKRTGRMNPEER